jgi:hypothetical protein
LKNPDLLSYKKHSINIMIFNKNDDTVET